MESDPIDFRMKMAIGSWTVCRVLMRQVQIINPMNYSILKLGDMSVQNIYILWVICAPIFLFAGWWVTKKIQSKHIRIITRSLIISIACGFGGLGTDSAAIILPAWALLLTPTLEFNGLAGIVIWWILVLAIYYVVNFMHKKLQSKQAAMLNASRHKALKNYSKIRIMHFIQKIIL